MTHAAVAVSAPADAARVARTDLPLAVDRLELGGSIIFLAQGDARTSERSVRIGVPPTSSRISVSEEGLVLERGPAWTAPIYYRTDAPIAASHITPLLSGDDRLNVGRLASIATQTSRYDESRTIYDGIRLVPPMRRVVLSAHGRSSSRVAPPPLEPIPRASIDDLAAELRRRFFGALQRATGDRPVAIMVSGGLDSSCVLAALLAVRGARPRDLQLTLDFDARYSDRPFVRDLETHYGISVFRVAPDAAPTEEAMLLDSVPSRHPTDPLDFAAASIARERGAELLVTGVGGDQLFGGYFASATAAALRDLDFQGAREAFLAKLPQPLPVGVRLRKTAFWWLRRHIPRAVLEMRARTNVADLPRWAGPRMRDERSRFLREHAARPAPRGAEESFQEMCLNPYDSDYEAELRAQNDFAFGIPRVDPLYDDELLRFLVAIPQQALFADGAYRGLLRRAMTGLVPESIRTRTTKSQFEPGLAGSIGPLTRFGDLLSFDYLDRQGIVRAAEFRRHLEPLIAAPSSDASGPLWLGFWSALTTERFLRTRS